MFAGLQINFAEISQKNSRWQYNRKALAPLSYLISHFFICYLINKKIERVKERGHMSLYTQITYHITQHGVSRQQITTQQIYKNKNNVHTYIYIYISTFIYVYMCVNGLVFARV